MNLYYNKFLGLAAEGMTLAEWTAEPTLTGPPVVELDTELVVVESFKLVLETLIFLGFLKNS